MLNETLSPSPLIPPLLKIYSYSLTTPSPFTANNVLAQSLISSCSINVGEASVERAETYYPFIQKLNYLKFSKPAKERYILQTSVVSLIYLSFSNLFPFFFPFQWSSFLKEFEGYLDDFQEMTTDIATCYDQDGNVKKNNTQGEIANSLLAKKEHNRLISLHCALNSFPSLIPRYLLPSLNTVR